MRNRRKPTKIGNTDGTLAGTRILNYFAEQFAIDILNYIIDLKFLILEKAIQFELWNVSA